MTKNDDDPQVEFCTVCGELWQDPCRARLTGSVHSEYKHNGGEANTVGRESERQNILPPHRKEKPRSEA